MHFRIVIARSEATWQSREGTCSPYRPSLKWYALPNCHCEGASRPWQSHAPTSEFAEVALLSTRGLRDCTPRALPRAARSGRHVGLRPPRNDNSGAFTILTAVCTDCKCVPGRGMPLQWHAKSREALIQSARADGERFFGKARFGKCSCTLCTRKGHAASVRRQSRQRLRNTTNFPYRWIDEKAPASAADD